MERYGRYTLVSMLIGFILGAVAGLLLAIALDEHGYAFAGFVLVGIIFGTLIGGLIGGMSRLGNTAPGDEPGGSA
jgi:uncharacterized membrane protein YoaK (UPF0700 family)